MNTKILIALVAVVIVLVGYGSFYAIRTSSPLPQNQTVENVETESVNKTTPKTEVETVTLSGTYVCLPLASGAPAGADCAFGIYTDEGEYYAINFGAKAGSMADFRDGERLTAKGTLIASEDLNPNSWTAFTSKGLFTVLEKL